MKSWDSLHQGRSFQLPIVFLLHVTICSIPTRSGQDDFPFITAQAKAGFQPGGTNECRCSASSSLFRHVLIRLKKQLSGQASTDSLPASAQCSEGARWTLSKCYKCPPVTSLLSRLASLLTRQASFTEFLSS